MREGSIQVVEDKTKFILSKGIGVGRGRRIGEHEGSNGGVRIRPEHCAVSTASCKSLTSFNHGHERPILLVGAETLANVKRAEFTTGMESERAGKIGKRGSEDVSQQP